MKRVVMSVRKNPKAEERALKLEWEEMLKRHSKPLERGAKALGVKVKKDYTVSKKQVAITQNSKLPPASFSGMNGIAAKSQPKVYSGTKVLGIAVMHKSNLVPIFNDSAAIEVAQMRRN